MKKNLRLRQESALKRRTADVGRYEKMTNVHKRDTPDGLENFKALEIFRGKKIQRAKDDCENLRRKLS